MLYKAHCKHKHRTVRDSQGVSDFVSSQGICLQYFQILGKFNHWSWRKINTSA